MTAQADPFVRVYYSVMGDDPKFEHVFDDDSRLACWLRLLLVADACYPAAAPLPQGIKKAPLAYLVSVELVDLLPGNRYRIHGLATERERRSERAAASARTRWQQSDRITSPDATAMRPQSDRSASAMRSDANPLLSAPIQSAPLLSGPATAVASKNGSRNKETTGATDYGEDTIGFYLSKWETARRDGLKGTLLTVEERLVGLGVPDPAAELAKRTAA